jgi:hypothetical protein
MIIGISGRKQAGKNTTANILHGVVLKDRGLIQDWNIGGSGELNILTRDSSGNEGWGEFDISRKDAAFTEYAEHSMWPYVKLYSFADELKRICIELFNIPFECVYGTDEQKNQVQKHLRWENMPGSDMAGPMTARQFMQYFGTDTCRNMYQPIWVNSCIKKIQREQSQLAIIADVRFGNEAKAIEEAGGKLVRLTRNIYNDNHSSEVALDNYPFTNYIDNSDTNIDDLTVKVKKFYNHLKE